MSVTSKIVSLIDKLHIQKFFIEKNNKVMLNFSFDPERLEEVVDDLIKVNGRPYQPNQFEKDVITELER